MVRIYKIRGKICSLKTLTNTYIDSYGSITSATYVGKSCKAYKVNLLRKFFTGKITCTSLLIHIKTTAD